MDIVKAMDLTKTFNFNENTVKAVDHVDLTIRQGEFIAICGPSGAGKSTLMHVLGGLERPDGGAVLIDGTSIYDLPPKELTVFRRRKIGFVFQAFNLLPFLSVRENILLPLGLDGRSADMEFLRSLMEMLQIANKQDCYPEQLSGGQQQRVAIARALMARPAIIIADEPTGNLDSRSGEAVMALLGQCCEVYGQTLLLVTHNERIAAEAPRVITIVDGRIVREV